jgi:hypothetical protein
MQQNLIIIEEVIEDEHKEETLEAEPVQNEVKNLKKFLYIFQNFGKIFILRP